MDSEQESSQQPTQERSPDDKVDLSEVREGDGQEYLDRDKLDFDPDDGLYSGTAVDGTSEIPGPHDEQGDEASVIEQAKQLAGDQSGDDRAPAQGHPAG
jgi:hypothetical protein